MGKYSVELYRMLGELPKRRSPIGGKQKIVKAGQYSSNAKHYPEGELNAPESEALDKAEAEQDDVNQQAFVTVRLGSDYPENNPLERQY